MSGAKRKQSDGFVQSGPIQRRYDGGMSSSTGVIACGVIGCGVIGRRHLAQIADSGRARLVAVADLSEELRDRATNEFGADRAYEDGEELIADLGVEAVVLALPAEPRYELARSALRAGKHVLLEKPAARSVAEVDEYLSLAHPGQVVAVASSRFRFLSSHAELQRALDAGGIRPIRQIVHEGLRVNPPRPEVVPPSWRLSTVQNGGGIMSNWGCYDLDYLLSLFAPDDRVVEASATWRGIPDAIRPWVAAGSDAETAVTALLRLASGATIVLNRGEYLPLPAARNATTILGDEAAVSCSIIAGEEPFAVTRYDEGGVTTSIIREEPDDPAEIHRGVLRDFVDAAVEGREPATDLARARHIQEITDTIYRSAREQRSIAL